jgi:DNA-binding response OmpR family regulator
MSKTAIKILISVEDNLEQLFTILLRERKYEMVSCDPHLVLETAKDSDIDCIVIYHISVENSYKIIRVIKSNPEAYSMPIILLESKRCVIDRMIFDPLYQPDEYLLVPFAIEEFYSKLEKVLDQ